MAKWPKGAIHLLFFYTVVLLALIIVSYVVIVNYVSTKYIQKFTTSGVFLNPESITK